MPIYKDSNNQLHELSDTDVANGGERLLPSDCVKITVEEAGALRLAAVVPPSYAELRAAEYPPITEYLDGIVKGDQAQIDAYIAKCQAVKNNYPKE